MSWIQNSSVATVVRWSVRENFVLLFSVRSNGRLNIMKNELANMQCNLTVAFQTAGWRFSQKLYIHILTDGLWLPNRLPWTREVIGWVKAQSPIPGTQCNRQNQSKNKAKIWGHASISAFLCVSWILFSLREDSPIFLGFWPSRCQASAYPRFRGSPESRNATSARAEAAGWDAEPLPVKLVFTENCNLCRDCEVCPQTVRFTNLFHLTQKGSPCKEAVDFTGRVTCSLFCPLMPRWLPQGWQHFIKLYIPVSPEFGKLTEKPVPTHWVSWPGEEEKLEGDWEMARETCCSHTETSWPAVRGHLCMCKHSLGWVLLEPNKRLPLTGRQLRLCLGTSEWWMTP